MSVSYASASTVFGIKIDWSLALETDDDGIRGASLKAVIDEWPASRPRLKLLYTVPVSASRHTPDSWRLIFLKQYGYRASRATASLERRREVLELAKASNFIILEGDAHFDCTVLLFY